jgi:hypothetical protein
MEDDLNAINDFSFYSHDSFEILVDTSQIRPLKPDCVPVLNLECLPDYVTSSEEGGEEGEEAE